MAKSDKSPDSDTIADAPPIDQTPHDPPDPSNVWAPDPRLAMLERMSLPPGLTSEEAARLRELRAAEVGGQISDAAKAELDALALKEADAAGHPRPESISPGPRADPGYLFAGDIVALLESIVDTVPALAGMRPTVWRLKAAHARLAEPKP